MLFSLKDIFINDGMTAKKVYTLSMDSVELFGVYPFKSPISVTAVASNRTGLVTLDLSVKYDFCRPCDRCCVDVEKHISQSFSHRVVESLSSDNSDEYIETTDFNLELDELVISDIILSLPSKYLCKGDCQGLCQKCGHNLNLGDCGCDRHEVDPRLEALKELLD